MTISETVSDIPKRKRGRPRLMTDSDDKMVDSCGPNIRTVRGRQDIFYRMEALMLLGLPGNERFRWLSATKAEVMAGKGGNMRLSHLTAIGRFYFAAGKEQALEAADWMCRTKPTAKSVRSQQPEFLSGTPTPPRTLRA